jgi:hypothetical protein
VEESHDAAAEMGESEESAVEADQVKFLRKNLKKSVEATTEEEARRV